MFLLCCKYCKCVYVLWDVAKAINQMQEWRWVWWDFFLEEWRIAKALYFYKTRKNRTAIACSLNSWTFDVHCSLHIMMLVLHTLLYQRSLFATFMQRHVEGDHFVAVNKRSISFSRLTIVYEQDSTSRLNIRGFKSFNPSPSRSVNTPIALKA